MRASSGISRHLTTYLAQRRAAGQSAAGLIFREPKCIDTAFLPGWKRYSLDAFDPRESPKYPIGRIKWRYHPNFRETIFLEHREVAGAQKGKAVGLQMTAHALLWHEQQLKLPVENLMSYTDEDNKRSLRQPTK